jgi:hypothetical protein
VRKWFIRPDVSNCPISLKNSMQRARPLFSDFRAEYRCVCVPRLSSGNQRPHHQFGIDRGTASAAIEGLQLLSNAIEFEMTVYSAQQVLGGDVVINAEAIKELRRSCLTSHRPDRS